MLTVILIEYLFGNPAYLTKTDLIIFIYNLTPKELEIEPWRP